MALSDRADAIEQLPEVHSRALRLRDEGFSESEIGARLGLEAVAIGPLLQIADAKLAAIMRRLNPH